MTLVGYYNNGDKAVGTGYCNDGERALYMVRRELQRHSFHRVP